MMQSWPTRVRRCCATVPSGGPGGPRCAWPAGCCRSSARPGSTSAASRRTTSRTSGHAATFVWADLVGSVAARRRRRGRWCCRNVTDVDDVLTAAAPERGRLYDELAVTQEFLFDRDMRALGRRRADARAAGPRARRAVVRLAEALLALGAAYERGRQCLLPGRRGAGRAGLDREAAARGVRRSTATGPTTRPRGPASTSPVWRPSAEERPGVAEPLGLGPSGLARRVRGDGGPRSAALSTCSLGGADLAFPHHAYQSAMVEAATGAPPFARARLPVGTVRHAGRKMAKSTGNLVLVSDLLEQVSPGGAAAAAARPAVGADLGLRRVAARRRRAAAGAVVRRGRSPGRRRSARRGCSPGCSTTWTSRAHWTSRRKAAGRRPGSPCVRSHSTDRRHRGGLR